MGIDESYDESQMRSKMRGHLEKNYPTSGLRPSECIVRGYTVQWVVWYDKIKLSTSLMAADDF